MENNYCFGQGFREMSGVGLRSNLLQLHLYPYQKDLRGKGRG